MTGIYEKKNPLMTYEGGINLILRNDLDLVVPTKSIQKGKYMFPYKHIKDLVNEGKWEMILPFGLFNFFLINTNSPLSIFLGDNNQCRHPFTIQDLIDESHN